MFKEEKEKLLFTIEGFDHEEVMKFKKRHDGCPRGIEDGRFSYRFTPTTLGMAVSVKCSCGSELCCGDFLDGGHAFEIKGDEKVYESRAGRKL